MELEFLKTLYDLQPCGVRAVVDVLQTTYTHLDHAECKSMMKELMSSGHVYRQGNGQYLLTEKGEKVIKAGNKIIKPAAPAVEKTEPQEPKPQPEKTAEPEVHAESKPEPEPEFKSLHIPVPLDDVIQSLTTDELIDIIAGAKKARVELTKRLEKIGFELAIRG